MNRVVLLMLGSASGCGLAAVATGSLGAAAFGSLVGFVVTEAAIAVTGICDPEKGKGRR